MVDPPTMTDTSVQVIEAPEVAAFGENRSGDEGFTELVYYPSADAVRDADGRLPDESVTMVERVTDHLLEVQHRSLEDPWLHSH